MEDPDIKLLEEKLPQIDKEKRAYLKGAAEALLYAQEEETAMMHCNDDESTETNSSEE